MTNEEQLRDWVAGKSIHNNMTNTHVPDYSCCYPELQAPKPIRVAFIMADDNTRLGFQTIFSRKTNEHVLKTNQFAITGEKYLTKH